MANNWILYYSPYLLQENNYKVDSLSTYLASCSQLVITGGQYIRNELNLMIKINKSQAKLEYNSDFTYNYMSIQNDGGVIYYYFILSKKWISSDTIALVLKMDTINTFALGTNYTLTNRTLINRQHKNRFRPVPSAGFSISGNAGNEPKSTTWGQMYRFQYDVDLGDAFKGESIILSSSHEYMHYTWNQATGKLWIYLFTSEMGGAVSSEIHIVSDTNPKRIIDLYSEGLTPILYGENIEQVEKDHLDWYVIYRGAESMDCYICCNEKITATISNDGTINPNDLEAGKYYYMFHGQVKINDELIKCYEWTGDSNWPRKKRVLQFRLSGTVIEYCILVYHAGYTGAYMHETTSEYKLASTMSVNSTADYYNKYDYYITTEETINLSTMEAGQHIIIPLGTVNYTIYPYSSITKTDAELYKIIKVPYCPLEYKYQNHSYNFGDAIIYDSSLHIMKLSSSVESFNGKLVPEENPLSYLHDASITNKTTESSKNVLFESKLYHSDYFQPKYAYDSFSFIIQLEKVEFKYHYRDWNITFITTRTPNSRFLFAFNDYVCEQLFTTDYYQVMTVARNNEMPIYNSGYIDYVRNGINYDVKTKSRSEFANIIGTSLKGVGTVASFALAPITGGLSATAGIALASSFTTSIISTVNSVAQSEQNMEQKINNLKMQSGSIYGSDDVDLMSYYTNNRLKYMIYKVSDKMQKALFDMFYFTGYVGGYQAIPDTSSRTWFNFVSCEPIFGDNKNIPQECLDDIAERFRAGITFMHRHNNKYDWNRQYENWETNLNIPNP